MTANVHASCVAVGSKGVLLLGASGAAKSDLALRLIDEGAMLVADDRTDLFVKRGKLFARAPEVLAGLIEVRGLGIARLSRRKEIAIALVVQLGRAGTRLPHRQFYTAPQPVNGAHPVSLITMDGREASASAKIRLALAAPPLFTDNGN
jgi:HPr kinase/phosphorylase